MYLRAKMEEKAESAIHIEERLRDALSSYVHYPTIRAIIEEHEEIDVNKLKNSLGWGALQFAALDGDFKFFKYLVEVRNALTQVSDRFGISVFMTAAENGGVDICQYLYRRGGIDLDEQDARGETALIKAAGHCSLGMCQFLVAIGADVNLSTKSGRTALFSAIDSRCDVSICQFLVERGAELNKCDKDGVTPFMHACFLGLAEIYQFLGENGADLEAKDYFNLNSIVGSARFNSNRACRYLLDKGVRLNERDASGFTAVHYLCRSGHYDLLKRFCFAGAQCPKFRDIQFMFNHSVGNETQRAIENYVMRDSIRQTMMILLCSKIRKRGGAGAKIRILNVDLIRRIFDMLIGLDITNIMETDA
jgi:ankyrin repeat protein